jgi:hypothetical protein
VTTGAAGPPVTGTIACSITGSLGFRPYLPLVLGPPLTKPTRLIASHLTGLCDPSGVVGGVGPIASADLELRGAMAPGSTCLDFLNTASLEKTKMKIRWKGTRNGRIGVIERSQALLASGSYDSGSNTFMLVTAPITKGAFLGSTLTMRIPMGDPDEYERICTRIEGAFSSFNASAANPWTIEVP